MTKPFLRLLLVVSLLTGGGLAGAAAIDEVSEADRRAIRGVIQAQIDAFRSDDAAAAFRYATPNIQARFGSPSRFIAMVKQGYLPVYRPRQVEFGELADVHGQLTQKVLLVGPENDVYSAYYLMQKQPAGDWRIDGCLLEPASDRAI